jgi:hypothetical protein
MGSTMPPYLAVSHFEDWHLTIAERPLCAAVDHEFPLNRIQIASVL